MIVTLVRHSEVIKEYQGKYNGHIDIPLSDKGKQDAKKLAKKLSHINFDKVYCSDLLRAKETLKAFDIKIEPIYSKNLREKSWGRHEGKSFQEIENDGIKYENFSQWIEALDGENIYTYKSRIKMFFYDIIFQNKSKNILVVTHSGVIKILLSITKKIPLEEVFMSSLDCSSFVSLDTDLI